MTYAVLAVSCLAAVSSGVPVRPPLGVSESCVAARQAFTRAFEFYGAHAFGRDEVHPLTSNPVDRSAVESLGVTLLESVDGLWAMGLDEHVAKAAAWASSELKPSRPMLADVRETSGRVLGGLLGAHAVTGDVRFAEAAQRVGDRILPAWHASPTGVPFAEMANLQHSVVTPEGDRDASTPRLDVEERDSRAQRCMLSGSRPTQGHGD